MNLLGNLPIVGRRSHVPSFKVEFKAGQEGLERLVELALNGGAGEYIIGETEATSPLAGINVRLFVDESGNYRLVARLAKEKHDSRVKADINRLKNEGFKVVEGSENTTIGEYLRGIRPAGNLLWFNSVKLPAGHKRIELSTIPKEAAELRYHSDPNGLTLSDVRSCISTFAQALELVVNGVYKTAGKRPSQPQALSLAPSEAVKRIKIERPQASAHDYRAGAAIEQQAKAAAKPAMASQSDLGETVTLADLGGLKKTTLDTISLITLACTNPELLATYGAQPLRGALLFGPPGTGKTSIGRAIASQSGLNFNYLNLSEITSHWYGDSEKNFVAFLEGIKKQGRGILYIDEIESLARKREGAHEATARLVNVLNQYMDGFQSMGSVIVMGATNLREEVDKATLSRFNYELEVPLPNELGRAEILGIHIRKAEKRAGKALFDQIDVSQLAGATPQYSGRDMATLVDRTCMGRLAAERLHNEAIRRITTQDFIAEIQRYNTEKKGNVKGPIGLFRK